MSDTELENVLKPYKLEVTQLGTIGLTRRTTHPSGGAAAIEDVGSWDRVGEVARGGNGTVFLETNTATGVLRAVKILTSGTESGQLREINAMLFVKQFEGLFVEFHAWYEHGDSKYISMEYVPGGDLMGYVRDVGALAEDEARAIAEQILQALFVLHENSLTHCDVKPQNILVIGKSPVRIKVADFGLTKKLDGSYHTTSGTWDWAAPEQRGHTYGQSVDMWAVGCVVYFLLTSLNPFVTDNDESPAPMIQRHTFPSWPRLPRDKFQERPNRISPGDQILVRGVSNAANDFLNRLIVRDPAGRMPVYQALCHPWIYDIPPLESALQRGDLRLSGMLARYDQRYQRVWADPLTDTTWQVILRFAAANGHRKLVRTALEHLPVGYGFTSDLPDWPDLPPALVGAARCGDCYIIDSLMNCAHLAAEEKSGRQMEQAIWAALIAGKLRVIDHFGYRTWLSVASKSQLSKYIAGYAHLEQLDKAIGVYRHTDMPPPEADDFVGPDESMYLHCFPAMLLATARAGNLKNLQHLLRNPPPSPLIISGNVFQMAVRMGHRDIVRFLLEHHLNDIGNSSELLQASIHTAAYYGQLLVAELLLKHGARPSGMALETAVSRNNNPVFQALLKALIHDGSPRNIDLAHQCALGAIAHCDVWLLRWLHTQSPNAALDIRKAAGFGNLAVVKYLLHQAPPYSPSPELVSAAFVGAAEVGNLQIVQYLLTCRIEVELADPWLVAATNGHLAVLELLLKCGLPARDVMSQAARLAARANHIGVVVLLMHHGAMWNGDCQPVVRAVVSAFGPGGELPEIGAAASRRR